MDFPVTYLKRFELSVTGNNKRFVFVISKNAETITRSTIYQCRFHRQRTSYTMVEIWRYSTFTNTKDMHWCWYKHISDGWNGHRDKQTILDESRDWRYHQKRPHQIMMFYRQTNSDRWRGLYIKGFLIAILWGVNHVILATSV